MMEIIESSALNHKGLQIITVIIINKNDIYMSPSKCQQNLSSSLAGVQCVCDPYRH